MVTCSGTSEAGEAEGSAPLRGRGSVTFGWGRAHLFFFDGEDVTFDKFALLAQSDLFFGKFTVTLGAGSILQGSLDAPDGSHEVGPGWLGSAGLSWRVLEDEGALPYLVFSATAGGAGVSTRKDDTRGSYLGIDFRFGATAGKTFFGWLSPYVALRAFGGPIFWTVDGTTEVGTDKYHVQGALGSVFILPEGFDLFVEGEPGGEQGVFGGVGYRY